jgi:hypothetical protein
MNTAKLSDETHEVRITSLTVLPRGEPLFGEQATVIGIDSIGDDEFVTVTQEGGHTGLGRSIAIEPEEWLVIRGAIDKMMEECRDHE